MAGGFFPCKFEGKLKQPTQNPSLHDRIVVTIAYEIAKSRTSSMSSPFFVVTLFHLGGQEKEKHWRWLAVRHFFRTRPSLRLSYSLPDLELVKDRAPEAEVNEGLNFRSC